MLLSKCNHDDESYILKLVHKESNINIEKETQKVSIGFRIRHNLPRKTPFLTINTNQLLSIKILGPYIFILNTFQLLAHLTKVELGLYNHEHVVGIVVISVVGIIVVVWGLLY